ncbi:hypothetical protein [Tsuneonella troitsensis]|uniref:hypothetical protein n=1 Tax=Tsuneonella troitsensis TaxID=292222 RepID=UPI00070EB33D|nr:hypothetical protein [Tsuneonella troitsensis]
MTPGSAQRIALIGNMNNANFALMRYLRDLGRDAHLYMYTNEADHFLPPNDTHDWDRWKDSVHRLPISNGGRDSLFAPLGKVEAALSGFDVYYGNGISPVLFDRMGRHLDVFAPYGDGVEFIIEYQWRTSRFLASSYSLLRKRAMERALQRSVETILTANMHAHSMDTYRRLGLQTTTLPLVALYDRERDDLACASPEVASAIDRMKSADLAIFSHVSHIWKNLPVDHFMGGLGKRNQWLLEGLSRYVKARPDAKPLLVMTEYGRDVGESKALIEKLGISDYCAWLPAMARKDILPILRYVDLGASEFAGMFWGGCGWEFLCKGVPMLHSLDDPEDYETPERPLPFFFNVSSPQDICDVLLRHDRASLTRLKPSIRTWYDTHQGVELARKYLALFDGIVDGRQTPGDRPKCLT